jgi:hypothetical protein
VLELFNLNTDFSQSENVASQNPQKVAELKQMFIGEAKKYRDASVAARIVAPRPNITDPQPRMWMDARAAAPSAGRAPGPLYPLALARAQWSLF